MTNLMRRISPFLLMFSLVSNTALADETYIGLNYDLANYSQLFAEKDSVSLTGVSLSLGHMFNRRWGIETKFGSGFNRKEAIDETLFGSDLIRIRMDNYFSLLMVTKFSFTERFNGAIKWGLTRAEVTQSKKEGNDWQAYREGERSGFIGGSLLWAMDYELNDTSAVNFEFGMLSNRVAINWFGMSLGVKTMF